MSAESPSIVARGVVRHVERISPAFARITFAGPDLDSFGNPGQVFDQRIKLVFPPDSGVLPELAGSDNWYAAWLALPEPARGSMRTYSIRELQIDEGATAVVIDFVLHLEPGLTGPASRWADAAQPGDELLLVGPRRGRSDGGGIEYHPGQARTILLAGDETAAPAIARILEDADPGTRGLALIEVPDAADALPIAAPAGVAVRWLPRDGAAHGSALIPAVVEQLAGAAGVVDLDDAGNADNDGEDAGTEDLLWETPRYSGLGEEVAAGESHADSYFWIAGESAVVTTVRRHLVKDLGIDRGQVAFMGYWRKGVAMRG